MRQSCRGYGHDVRKLCEWMQGDFLDRLDVSHWEIKAYEAGCYDPSLWFADESPKIGRFIY